MCILFFAIRCHPEYTFIIAANRDEFYSRPSRAANFWGTTPEILAGKDLVGGGTWLGITSTGKVAAITNFRDPLSYVDTAPSRGRIVLDFLKGNKDINDPDTGVGIQKERMLAPLFIISPDYGTCSSTVILLARDDNVSFFERSYYPFEEEQHSDVEFHFKMETL